MPSRQLKCLSVYSDRYLIVRYSGSKARIGVIQQQAKQSGEISAIWQESGSRILSRLLLPINVNILRSCPTLCIYDGRQVQFTSLFNKEIT